MNYYFDISNCKEFIKPRRKETHKGSYGKIAIIAGSLGMSGSVCMSSMSALRSGSGLVYTVIPECIANIVSIKLTECVIRVIKNSSNTDYFSKNSIDEIFESIVDCDCIAIGPGLRFNNDTIFIVSEILKNVKKPVIIDADGLNCLSKNINILKSRDYETILTPHKKEFERLLSSTNIDFNDRIQACCDFSKEYGVTTLLKGYHTVISNPEGQYYINPTGNPGMATAGSGDVLTGIIASLVGQGIDSFHATCCGAYIHGFAGDIGAKDKTEYGLIATDIINYIPDAFKEILISR